jgi:flagella basal body P-ring formation protein FlgA
MARATAIFLLLVCALSAGVVFAQPVFAQSVTAVRAIRSKTVLAAEDLVVAEAAVPGGVAAVEDAIGLEAKVALYPGRPILASQLRAPALVERNAVVRMSYASGPLRIVTEGRALDRAGAGEAVRVMNLASKQTVTGVVAADGTIEVGR